MATERNGSGGTFLDQNRNATTLIFERFGRTDITLTKRTKTLNASGRVGEFSVVTSTITGDLQFVTYKDREMIQEGIANLGDGIFYTAYDVTIGETDEITVDSVVWRMKKRVEAETLGTGRLYQAWVCTRKNVS